MSKSQAHVEQFSRSPITDSSLGKSRGPPQSPAETPQNPRSRALGETPAEPSERQISSESLSEGCAPQMVTLRNFRNDSSLKLSGPQKGPAERATSKNDQNRQKVSKIFSALFDIFRAGQKTSKKKTKKCQKYFLQLSRGTSFRAPFWGALMKPLVLLHAGLLVAHLPQLRASLAGRLLEAAQTVKYSDILCPYKSPSPRPRPEPVQHPETDTKQTRNRAKTDPNGPATDPNRPKMDRNQALWGGTAGGFVGRGGGRWGLQGKKKITSQISFRSGQGGRSQGDAERVGKGASNSLGTSTEFAS